MLTFSHRWVRPITDQTNKGAESKVPWFKTYRPPNHEGWYYLGQSIDSRWALLVKDNAIEGTEKALPPLAPVLDADVIQQNTGSSAKDWETFWMLRPGDTENYVVLGDYFNADASSYVQPDPYQKPLNLMRAVRKDLCLKTTLEKEPVNLYPITATQDSYGFFGSTGLTKSLLIRIGSAFGSPYVPLSSFSHINALNVLP